MILFVLHLIDDHLSHPFPGIIQNIKTLTGRNFLNKCRINPQYPHDQQDQDSSKFNIQILFI